MKPKKKPMKNRKGQIALALGSVILAGFFIVTATRQLNERRFFYSHQTIDVFGTSAQFDWIDSDHLVYSTTSDGYPREINEPSSYATYLFNTKTGESTLLVEETDYLCVEGNSLYFEIGEVAYKLPIDQGVAGKKEVIGDIGVSQSLCADATENKWRMNNFSPIPYADNESANGDLFNVVKSQDGKNNKEYLIEGVQWKNGGYTPIGFAASDNKSPVIRYSNFDGSYTLYHRSISEKDQIEITNVSVKDGIQHKALRVQLPSQEQTSLDVLKMQRGYLLLVGTSRLTSELVWAETLNPVALARGWFRDGALATSPGGCKAATFYEKDAEAAAESNDNLQPKQQIYIIDTCK